MNRKKLVVLLVLLCLALAAPILWAMTVQEKKPVLTLMVHTAGGDRIQEKASTLLDEYVENDVFIYPGEEVSIPLKTETKKTIARSAYFFELYSDKTLVMSVGIREPNGDMAAEQSLQDIVTTYTKVLLQEEYNTFLGYAEEAYADPENTIGPMHEDTFEPYVYFYYKNDYRIWPFVYAHTKPRHELRYMLRSFFPDEIDTSMYVVKTEKSELYRDTLEPTITTNIELRSFREAFEIFYTEPIE